jgi:hypothetical protein
VRLTRNAASVKSPPPTLNLELHHQQHLPKTIFHLNGERAHLKERQIEMKISGVRRDLALYVLGFFIKLE